MRVMPKAQKNMMARGMIIRAAGERSASLRYRESSMGNFLLLKKRWDAFAEPGWKNICFMIYWDLDKSKL